MYIETMDINGIQTPVAISTCNGINKKNYKIFVIDSGLIKTNTN
jgi:hypothetical protein